MKIRKAKKSEAARILKLLNSDSNLAANKDDMATIKDVKQYLEGGTHRVYVYIEGDEIAGLVIAQFFKIAKWVYLNYVVVDKKYQRQGIGKSLFEHLEKTAKDEGFYLIELLTKTNNIKLEKLARKTKYSFGGDYSFYYKKL